MNQIKPCDIHHWLSPIWDCNLELLADPSLFSFPSILFTGVRACVCTCVRACVRSRLLIVAFSDFLSTPSRTSKFVCSLFNGASALYRLLEPRTVEIKHIKHILNYFILLYQSIIQAR